MPVYRYERLRIILIFFVFTATGLLWSVGCGSEDGEQLDVGFDADVALPDVEEDLKNGCGGDDELVYDDEVVEPGDSCGACEDGTIACDGEDEVRCARAEAANECGGCEPLPGAAGTPCGPCESGTWACDGDGGMTCVDALEHNPCGGCGDLVGQPTTGCEDAAGEGGVWGCTGPDAVRCVLPGENACGGVLDLEEEPGTGCGTCDGGVWACESESDVTCTNPDWGVNVCGGCEPLFGVLGDPCGVCDGEWSCDGPDDVFCDEPPRNACGGCTELGSNLPGQECRPSVVYICQDEETLTCPEDGTNVCGGSGELAHIPGDSCGECGDGEYFCASSEELVCVGESSRNACDGCGELDEQPGDACGPCGLDTVVCDGETSTVCDGSTPCPILEVDTQPAGGVTDGAATFYGLITELPLNQITDHGFCWSPQENPTPINGDCHSLGAVDEPRSFEHTTDDLLPGRSYFVRAFATVGTIREYADEVAFTTTAVTPEDVEASDGEYTDFVEISWEDDSADEYIIYRDGTAIATVDAADGRFEDTEATAADVPLEPQNVEASDGTFSDYILVSWDEAESPEAPEHTYQIVAVYPDQTSDISAEFTGRRKAFEIDTYELSIDGDDWFDVGLVEEYEDEEAPFATITPGTASASGGDYETHVALEQLDSPTVESHPVSYRVRAVSEAGESDESQEAVGTREVGDTLYYQWYFSDEDDPGSFNALFSPATTDGDQHDDESAPADGSIRSYYLAVSAEGAVTANTDVVTGFRAASADISTEPVTAVDVNQATVRGNLMELGSPPPSQHGFCYGTMADPTHGSGADCSELGSPTSEGVFEETLVGLSGGTTYYVRAYITNADGTSYGGVVEFSTLSDAPSGLVATSHTDHVALSWDGVTGANEYRIYRDGSVIATVSTTTYDDTGAAEGGTADAPSLTATSGTYTDRVELSWNEPDIDDGPDYDYHVIAVSDGGDSEVSNTAQGNRDGYPVTSYEIEIDGGNWSDVGNTTSFSDTGADAPSIDAGTASASDGDSAEHVALSLNGTQTSPGDDSTYRVRAINDTGDGAASTQQDGHRNVDTGDLLYQWSFSDSGSGGPFDTLGSPSGSSSYNDQTAPADGSTRHYFVTVSADDVPSEDSSVVSGFRAAEPQVDTNSPTGVDSDEATLHADITELGAPEPTEHGFCYGTMADPTHGSGAVCTTLGDVSSTGSYQQVVTGLSAGTTYYVRAYVTNDADTFYGEPVGFSTLSDAPTGLVATSHTDHVALSWDGATGANEYRIYRDSSVIATVSTTTYDDTGAAEGGTADAPALTATSGTYTDRVDLSWDEPDIDDGPEHDYHVIAVSDGGDSEVSNTAQGNRDGYPVTSYELQIDGGAWLDVGDATEYLDESAAPATISGGVATASEGQFETHVVLEVSDLDANDGELSNYVVRALNAVGDGSPSDQVSGYRAIGSLSFQWYRSAGENPENYEPISGATGDIYEDTQAPEDGAIRHYRVAVTADDADEYIVNAGEGYRAIASDPDNAWQWESVSTGGGVSCAIRDDQSLWCWGANFRGQLGQGDTDSRNTPHQVDSSSQWQAVSVSSFHTCAVHQDGTLWCWGDNEYGQLGTGQNVGDQEESPQQVGGGDDWLTINTSGNYHTCGVREVTDGQGTLWCWGRNNNAQLGQGGVGDESTPVQVGSAQDWIAVAGGDGTTCGIREVADGQGTLWCWGNDPSFGSLGLGSTETALTPEQVGSDQSWEGLSRRSYVSCAWRDDASLWCWGNNNSGALGLGDDGVHRDEPTLVAEAPDIQSAGAGGCAIGENGERWCWGANWTGQAGLGDTETYLEPTYADDGDEWRIVSTKDQHACGIRDDDSLWCWGSNSAGQIGIGDADEKHTPQPVIVDEVELSQACAGVDHCVDDAWCPEDTTERYCAPDLRLGSNEIEMSFQYIPGGTFDMGSPEEELGRIGNESQVEVTLTRDFYMQRTEVTQGQWKALSDEVNPAYFTTCGDDCPVEQVSWWSIMWFANELSEAEGLPKCYDLDSLSCTGEGAQGTLSCGDLMPPIAESAANGNPYDCTGYRLPMEAEWERAARAGTTTATYVGDLSSTGCFDSATADIAWNCHNANGETQPVEQLLPNNWGLFDMLGNVEEWVWDRHGPSDHVGGTDPRVEDQGSLRVLRGGNFDNNAAGVRSAFRDPNRAPPELQQTPIGFRLARTAHIPE